MNKPLRILHLEDDRKDAELIQRKLKDEGITSEIVWVQSQEDFEAAMHGGEFDLILADYTVPTFDGMAALAMVRKHKEETPFIFVSRTMGEDVAIESLKEGASDYVLKQRLDRIGPSVRRALKEAQERRLRNRLQETTLEQAALLDKAHDAIVVSDLEERIQFWNKGAERLYVWTSAEAAGSEVIDWLSHGNDDVRTANRMVREHGEWNGELLRPTKDGRKVVVSSRWTLLFDPLGNPRSVLSIDTDITEKRNMEAQFANAQRMEIIGRLASGIAHDLNNILSPILFSVPMLRWGSVGEEFEKTVRTIEASAKRGAEVVKQLLTYGRGIEGERVLFHPKQLIHEMKRVINQTFPKNIEFAAVIPDDLWPISGDIAQLHQVLMNLCVNGRDAMPGGGKLTITAENIESDGQHAAKSPKAPARPNVVLRVSDTGKGIPPEYLEQIFDPFFTTKEAGKGSGLGLSTAIGLVKSHGGTLSVRSELGSGSTFELFLPASPKAALATSETSPAEIRPADGELILVVDDEKMICEVTKKTLERHGYKVLTACDGVEGIALYAQHRAEIDLVLTDLNMPHMDGASLIKALKRIEPNVKIIASSGISKNQGEQAKKEEAGRLGVKMILTKPYTAEQMLLTIEATLAETD